MIMTIPLGAKPIDKKEVDNEGEAFYCYEYGHTMNHHCLCQLEENGTLWQPCEELTSWTPVPEPTGVVAAVTVALVLTVLSKIRKRDDSR